MRLEDIRAGDTVKVTGMGFNGESYLISRVEIDTLASHFSAGRCGYYRLYFVSKRGNERLLYGGFGAHGRDMRTQFSK